MPKGDEKSMSDAKWSGPSAQGQEHLLRTYSGAIVERSPAHDSNVMMRRLALACVALTAMWITGCSTPMVLDGKTTSLQLEKQSYILATLVLQNDYRTPLLPTEVVLHAAGNWSNADAIRRTIDAQGKADTQSADACRDACPATLIRVAVTPGRYRFSKVVGELQRFGGGGGWVLPLAMSVDVPQGSVVYVGRITAHLRASTEYEFRAGELYSSFLGALTRQGGVTFDVDVSDQSAVDLARFRSSFPVLRDVPVRTSLLPPFDRTWFDRNYKGRVPIQIPVEERQSSGVESGESD